MVRRIDVIGTIVRRLVRSLSGCWENGKKAFFTWTPMFESTLGQNSYRVRVQYVVQIFFFPLAPPLWCIEMRFEL